MVSKCTNPKCRAVFRYLHEGKLFEFEVRTFDEPSGEGPGPKHHETRHRVFLAMRLVRFDYDARS
jgi:hypothetical protein